MIKEVNSNLARIECPEKAQPEITPWVSLARIGFPETARKMYCSVQLAFAPHISAQDIEALLCELPDLRYEYMGKFESGHSYRIHSGSVADFIHIGM